MSDPSAAGCLSIRTGTFLFTAIESIKKLARGVEKT